MEVQKGFDIDAIVKEVEEEFAAEAEDQPEESVEEPELEEEVLDDEEEVLEEDEEADDDDEDEDYDDEDEDEDEDDEYELDSYDSDIDPDSFVEIDGELVELDDEELEAFELESEDVHKRNEAFRRLREERDQLAESERFLNDLAKQYGLTKDQLIERFEKDQIKKEAEEQGLTEDQVRKMRDMERQLQEVEEEKNREVFNIKAEALSNKYNLNEGQMIRLFEEAATMGIDVLKNPNLLEFAYRAVNYEKAIDEGRQKQLETTKKRSKTSTGTTGTRGREPVVTDDEQWDKEIDELLKDLNI